MEKVFRDPVHSLMRFDTEEDKLILDLIETRELQRLRFIKLMGVSYTSYPGAEHTRFAHSIATAYLMKRVIERIELLKREPKFSRVAEDISKYRELLTCTALLHDIGHFPFSHLLEEFTKEHHEDWSVRIIADSKSEVHQRLVAVDQSYPRKIKEVLERRFKPSFAVKLISSQLDVDRMDYLLRDSLYTGVGYGNFDLDWLIHSLRIIEVDSDYELAIDQTKGSRAAEGYVLARYYMYQQVYHHKSSRAAGVMVGKILSRAAELVYNGKEIFATTPLRKLLVDRKGLSIEDHLNLDDVVLLFALKEWERGDDRILADLCARLNHGKIFKTLDIGMEQYTELQGKIEKIAIDMGFDPDYYIAVDSATDNPYSDNYLLGRNEVGENIFLVDDKLALNELSSHSELIAAIRNKVFGVDRLCFPEEMSEAIASLTGQVVS